MVSTPPDTPESADTPGAVLARSPRSTLATLHRDPRDQWPLHARKLDYSATEGLTEEEWVHLLVTARDHHQPAAYRPRAYALLLVLHALPAHRLAAGGPGRGPRVRPRPPHPGCAHQGRPAVEEADPAVRLGRADGLPVRRWARAGRYGGRLGRSRCRVAEPDRFRGEADLADLARELAVRTAVRPGPDPRGPGTPSPGAGRAPHTLCHAPSLLLAPLPRPARTPRQVELLLAR
jgi:hypothetical protein